MLTSLIRSRTILGYSLTYLISGAILFGGLHLNKPIYSLTNPIYDHWAFEWAQFFPDANGIMCLLLLVIGTILSRFRTRDSRPVLASTNLTMVCFAAIAATQIHVVFSRPDVVLALLLGMFIFMLVIHSFKQVSALSEIFHVGLLLGSMSLIVGPTIFLVVSVGFSLLVLRTGTWKEWAVLFFGIVMCVVFILMVVIWDDNMADSFKTTLQAGWLVDVGSDAGPFPFTAIPILVIAFSGIFSNLTLGTVNERNITLSMVGWMAGLVLITLLLNISWQSGILLAAFPLSNFCAQTLDKTERWWLADLVLLTILALPLVSSRWPF